GDSGGGSEEARDAHNSSLCSVGPNEQEHERASRSEGSLSGPRSQRPESGPELGRTAAGSG
ncbi:hypothetical protein XENOCAPTIV_021797, partial [Xenoophorus captivus]